MEQYNWIKAYYNSEEEVFVRQVESCSEYFISDKGNRFHISELDLTQNASEPNAKNFDVFKQFEEAQERMKEQNAAYNDLMNKMIASMDANTIADHKAKIDEREYWRKLRGDIALEIIRKRGDKEHYNTPSHFTTIADATRVLFSELYKQDQEFFKDK